MSPEPGMCLFNGFLTFILRVPQVACRSQGPSQYLTILPHHAHNSRPSLLLPPISCDSPLSNLVAGGQESPAPFIEPRVDDPPSLCPQSPVEAPFAGQSPLLAGCEAARELN